MPGLVSLPSTTQGLRCGAVGGGTSTSSADHATSKVAAGGQLDWPTSHGHSNPALQLLEAAHTVCTQARRLHGSPCMELPPSFQRNPGTHCRPPLHSAVQSSRILPPRAHHSDRKFHVMVATWGSVFSEVPALSRVIDFLVRIQVCGQGTGSAALHHRMRGWGRAHSLP